MSERTAAVSYVRWGGDGEDGRFLAVWNPRHRGWGMPGGLVEEGETAQQAQARELEEETGLRTHVARLAYEGPHGLDVPPGRATRVAVFVVEETAGMPGEGELDCPVRWVTRAEFLASSPFAPFYERLFREGVLT